MSSGIFPCLPILCLLSFITPRWVLDWTPTCMLCILISVIGVLCLFYPLVKVKALLGIYLVLTPWNNPRGVGMRQETRENVSLTGSYRKKSAGQFG